MKRPDLTTAAWVGVSVFLALNVAYMALRVPFDMFDADELQHAHIAWLVAGGQVIYRDFWEHHGPFFALLNGFLLYLTQAEPSATLILWCRAGSVLATGGILLLTYRIARLAALRPIVALTSVALLASLTFLQDKGSECRPDTWQNLFWFAGLWLALGNASRRSPGITLLTGALLGLAVLTNTKAALGPLVLALYYVFGRRLHGLDTAAVLRELAALAAGAVGVYLVFLAYFLANGAAREFNFFNTVWNLMAAENEAGNGRGLGYLGYMAREQSPFLIAAGLGLVFWMLDLLRPAGELAKPAGWMVASVAIGTGWSWGLNNFPQFFLLFLPLWAVLAAFGLAGMVTRLSALAGTAGNLTAIALLLVTAALMGRTAGRYSLLSEHPALKTEKAFTAALVQGTPRTEPIGALWDVCGGFMFNASVQYYWIAEPAIGAVVERHTGSNPFGAAFVEALERQHVRFVVGRDGDTLARLPPETRQYLRQNFYNGNCLWTRRG